MKKYLQKLLEEGLSNKKTAAALGRSPSSVSRELKRNGSKDTTPPPTAPTTITGEPTVSPSPRRDHRRTALPEGSFMRSYVCKGLSLF